MSAPQIETKDSEGRVNGYLIPIWNALDGPRVDQVYLTVIKQGMMKGPHLHKKRRGLFKCVRGSVLVVWREQEGYVYQEQCIGPKTHLIEIPPGTPAALYNIGIGDAFVLNLPSPAWRPDDVDEHEVVGWNYVPTSVWDGSI